MVEGVHLTKKHYPVLYDWAQTHPETLARILRESAKKMRVAPSTVAQSLESDLEHDFPYY